jgi:hypothetical protein
MDHDEASALLHAHLEPLRQSSYAELSTLLHKPRTCELSGASGAVYQVEVLVYWDDRPGGALRVIGSIDDCGWRAWMPCTDDFVLAPDGRFIGK